MTTLPSDIQATWRRNLDALHAADPALVQKLAEVPWPQDLAFCPALDGTLTAFSRTFSRSGWFASSGAPKVREQALCESFAPGPSNVLLPAAGQGCGLNLLLRRFEPCQSLFVWEPQVTHLATVLALYDFARDLADRRVIFISDPDLRTGLVKFLSDHRDLVPPEKMMSWPWIDDHRMQEISLTVDQAVREAHALLAAETAELETQLDALAKKNVPDRPRKIFVGALTLHPVFSRWARDFFQAARKLNYQPDLFLLDRPSHASAVGVLRHLIDHRPDVILSVGMEKNRWIVKTPAAIPFISVLAPPGVALGETRDVVAADNEILVVGSREDGDRLAAVNVPEKIFSIELAVNSTAHYPRMKQSDPRIVILADRPDPDPQRAGIRPVSHQRLWNGVAELIGRRPLAYHDDLAKEWIDDASRATQVNFTDATLLDSFTRLVREVLAPAAVAESVAGALHQAGFRFRIYGSGWNGVLPFGEFAHPQPESSDAFQEILHQADLALYLDNWSNARQVVLDVLCAGRALVLKKIPGDKLLDYPELAQGVRFLDPDVPLTVQIASVVKDLPALYDRAARAREYLVRRHDLSGYLRQILARLGSPDR